ncbi:TolC family protein [Anaeromyxobacter diazotrophicus]|nr:TolC family protein [Anaeromyxobacter diazotrophicus]
MARFLVALGAVMAAAHASALQPLEEFLRGARASGADDAEARALHRQAGADAQGALGRALPRLSLRGTYTRNQYETDVDLPAAGGGTPATVTITPKGQLDGSATLDVPLVNLATFAGIAAARTGARAAGIAAAATDLRVQAQVAQDYYQLVANVSLVGSSKRALEVARASLQTAERLHAAGSVPLLDVDRAGGEVERDVQQVAAAELQVALVARALASASGVTPELDREVTLADDLHEEPPLERFQPPDDHLPSLAAAIERRVSAEQLATAQRLALVPSLSASITERGTNATGFSGREFYWQGVVALTWSFDLTTVANIRSQDAAADAARAREQRARLAARDDIHATWRTVATDIARSRSARVQAQVNARAAQLALERYQAGTATQLDLLQAQRDAFAADAGRIQADADLVNARAQLRIAAGVSLLEPRAEVAP